ncbi:glycosyltransferase, family 2 [Arcobacter venerupis]|uniref:Glycosyltransferase, family 2 n=2 Tax=Arcobacter venerupis TaxID=1054033 RepID=A0AAE7BCA0_9BACT|nr:glycosyltransferase, family 2 [Arcobacter venerupis]RWS49009.1 hypothetical protein CKA56_11345 [Arcobacter venerupis]
MSGIKMNTNKTKVTIVTVTYNAQEYLEQTIKSIIEQDYPNIEYIIIDGASTDKTVDIIKKYEKYITYWISEPDTGIYDAMNKGINVATGEWINFMNAGDSFCENNTILNVIKSLKNDTDLISGDIYYIENDEKTYHKQQLINYPMQNMFCYHQTLFTKTSIMKQIKFSTEFRIAGDYDFVLKCYIKNYKFQYLNFAIANFISGGLAESQNIIARIEDIFIQSKYTQDSSDIFNSYSFTRLNSYNKTNNSLFTRLLNNLYLQCQEYDLDKKKFVLYGYGNIGEIIYNKYENNITHIIDQNHENIIHDKLYGTNLLSSLNFEYILISVLGKEKEIKKYLIKTFNIPESKILTFKI